MSDNNQTPNWNGNQSGPGGPGQNFGGQWQGAPAPGHGSGPQAPTGPPPHPGAPQQGFPQQGYQQQPQQGWGPQPGVQQSAPAKKRGKAPLIIAGALALALVLGGVVFAMNFLRGSTPAASAGIPANALAVMEVNLNPSVADKLALKDFAEKFPELAENMSDVEGDYKKALYQAITVGDNDVPDYSEVEPWLGDSLAIAAIPSSDGSTDEMFGPEPDALASIQVTDRDKAEAFMAEHGDGLDVQFMDDLMLITEEGIPADVAAIEEAPLAESEDYKTDMDKLGGSWLATGWVGDELFKQLGESITESAGVQAEVPNTRMAMGLKVEDGSAVLRNVSWTDQELGEGPATSFFESLPATSLGAMSLSLPDSMYDTVWEQLEPLMMEVPELGIQSKEDFQAILGSEMAVAIEMDQDGLPVIGVKVRTDDPATHEAFLDTLSSDLGMVGIEHAADGDVVTTTFGQSLSEFTAPAGTLADNPTAQDLTKGNGDVQGVMWVDIPALLTIPDLGLDPSAMQSFEPLSGIGMSSSTVGDGYAETFIRVGTK